MNEKDSVIILNLLRAAVFQFDVSFYLWCSYIMVQLYGHRNV